MASGFWGFDSRGWWEVTFADSGVDFSDWLLSEDDILGFKRLAKELGFWGSEDADFEEVEGFWKVACC